MSTDAPQRSANDRFFDDRGFHALVRSEPGHFWFESRRRLIVEFLRTHGDDADDYLEIGTGTGFVLGAIAVARPSWRLVATDFDTRALAHVADRVARAQTLVMDALAPALRPRSFGAIGAYDVIEHIEDDAGVLRRFFELLRPAGTLLITVPQHRWLWSSLDELSGHVRRYTRRELVEKVQAAGFVVDRVTSFASLTLPLMAAARWTKPAELNADQTVREVEVGRLTNAILTPLMGLERLLIRGRVPLPAGGSLLLAARRS